MTYFERVDVLRDGANFTAENYEIEYITAELVLVDLFGEYLKGAEIISTTYGTGKVVSTSGDTLDQMLMEVAFENCTKKFGVLTLVTGKVLFNKFADISEIGDAWDHAFDLHTDMTRKLNEFKRADRQTAADAKKKAIEDKKNAEKYEATKAKAIKDFEARTQAERTLSTADEFYYSLGWLTKNATSLSAAMPDYLLSYFEQHFGTAYKPTVVDSKKRTVNGYAMQWAMSMKAVISSKASNMPAYLTKYLSQNGKHLADTSFVWDLVENYGFTFGKKQDIEKIRSHVPSDCIASFEASLA